MKALEFSKTKRKRPLSHYKILRCHVRYTDKSRIDTVKPGTILGFTNSQGEFYSIEDYFKSKYNKQEQTKAVEQTQNKDDNIM